jgi:hypothetical protein
MEELKRYRQIGVENLMSVAQTLNDINEMPVLTGLEELVFEFLVKVAELQPGEPIPIYQEALEHFKVLAAVEKLAEAYEWDTLCFWIEQKPSTLPVRNYYRIKFLDDRGYLMISKNPKLRNRLEDGLNTFDAEEMEHFNKPDPILLSDLCLTDSEFVSTKIEEVELRLQTLFEKFGFKVTAFSDKDWKLIEDASN